MPETNLDAGKAHHARPTGVLLYGMYDLARMDRAPEVRIEMMTRALSARTHTERIVGGRLGRSVAGLRWLIGGGPRRVGAVYVESATTSAMPTDLAFLLLMRMLGRPVGVYFRDAYQLYRDVDPRTKRRQVATDWLWRLSTPLLKRVATVRYAPSPGLAKALRISDGVMLPPGTDPTMPELGPGEPDVVAAIAQVSAGSGLDTLIEAMALVRERRPAARLRVLARSADRGKGGSLPEWVEVIQARRDSMADLLRPSRVCVLPLPINRYTDLAVAVRLLDLLGFGKPIVATDTTETRAIIAASQAGIVTQDTPAGLAQGMLAVLDDDGLARSLAANARSYARSSGATWDARALTVLQTLGLAGRADAGDHPLADGRAGRSVEANSTDVAPERPLRLAFIGDPNSIHTRRWLTFFADRGHCVHLLVPSADSIEEPLPAGIEVHRFLAWPHIPIPGLPRIATAIALRLALRRIRPDVLHAHFLARYGWAARLSGFRPYVITVWGSDVFVAATSSAAAQQWARRSLSGAALITAVSEDLARRAIELGARPERVRIAQFGFDPRLFVPGPAPESLRDELRLRGRRVVLSPRGMTPLYRHEVAILTLALLPGDVALVLSKWQAEPSYLAQLEALTRELDLESRVRFVPPIPHDLMANYYRLADVVVSVPRTDAFPVTVLEAMACGTPVVVSDLPSAHEGLAGVDPGAIVAGDDPEAVAGAIGTRLGLSSQERVELGGRLREAAVGRGDVSRSLLQVERWYRSLASGRPLE